MDNTADFIELLKAVTVDSKDNGEGFVVSRRVEAIERLLKLIDSDRADK